MTIVVRVSRMSTENLPKILVLSVSKMSWRLDGLVFKLHWHQTVYWYPGADIRVAALILRLVMEA
jgi:hypothetical protein